MVGFWDFKKIQLPSEAFFLDLFVAGKLFFHNKNVEKAYKIKVFSQKMFIQNLTPLFIFLGIPCRELEIASPEARTKIIKNVL